MKLYPRIHKRAKLAHPTRVCAICRRCGSEFAVTIDDGKEQETFFAHNKCMTSEPQTLKALGYEPPIMPFGK